MSCDSTATGQEGLKFFGKMSASISHEIKNVLAIINENAGLLEDLTLMADKGTPLDIDRLKNISQMIAKQIRRADSIVKNMNAFAHSADEPVKTVELNDILALMVTLSERLASMRGVKLEHQESQGPVSITTNPFVLENTLWLTLDFAMNAVDSGKTLRLSAEKSDNSIEIRFKGLRDFSGMDVEQFPGTVLHAMLHSLKADISVRTESEELAIIFTE